MKTIAAAAVLALVALAACDNGAKPTPGATPSATPATTASAAASAAPKTGSGW